MLVISLDYVMVVLYAWGAVTRLCVEKHGAIPVFRSVLFFIYFFRPIGINTYASPVLSR